MVGVSSLAAGRQLIPDLITELKKLKEDMIIVEVLFLKMIMQPYLKWELQQYLDLEL